MKKKPKKPNNDKKQLCKKCKYRGTVSAFQTGPCEPEARICCDYIGATGHPRIKICDDPDYCTVYKPGKPLKRREQYPKVMKNF